jgi:uncharacterized protein YbbK (DUF523 family)/uncharacterized protein YbgA (DUF1722 family)
MTRALAVIDRPSAGPPPPVPATIRAAAAGPLLRLGVSSCLLGEEVRYNGGHSRDDFLTGALRPWVEWVPVCPEVEIGLGTPRETIRLTGSPDAPRLIAPKSGRDLTATMTAWSARQVERIAAERLHGYVLKKGSPTCGLHRVRVYEAGGNAQRTGRGLFAAALAERLPLLALEEEGRLHDPVLRESFLERAFAARRFERLLEEEPTLPGLLRFHADHKLALCAHSPAGAAELGRLLARAAGRPFPAVARQYASGMASVLRVVATRGRHANVLEHLLGFLRTELGREDRAEVVETIRQYHRGWIPLPVPIALLRHHLRRAAGAEWARRQVYLAPYPEALALRSAL